MIMIMIVMMIMISLNTTWYKKPRLTVHSWGGWVAPKIIVLAPVPSWPNWGLNWVGLGWDWVWGDWGLRGWGLGLDNKASGILKGLREDRSHPRPNKF